MGRQAEEGSPRSRFLSVRVTEPFEKKLGRAAKTDGSVSKYLRRIASEDMQRRGID